MKEAKKAARELEEKRREDTKKREQQQEEERKKAEEKQKLEEQKQEEEEKRLQEEKERKELEEYMKMKEAFMVEEEGYEHDEEEGGESSLQKFISYIKDNKVVVIEDLAVQFKLKSQAVIDRITDLQQNGELSGVMDDRGKFIYVSQEELQAFARFIKQRGRVSLAELMEGSNKLINLQPKSNTTQLISST